MTENSKSHTPKPTDVKRIDGDSLALPAYLSKRRRRRQHAYSKADRATRAAERAKLYSRWLRTLQEAFSLGPASDPVLGILDFSKPGRLKASLFRRTSEPGTGAHLFATQAQLLKQRRLWIEDEALLDAQTGTRTGRQLRAVSGLSNERSTWISHLLLEITIQTESVPPIETLNRLWPKE